MKFLSNVFIWSYGYFSAFLPLASVVYASVVSVFRVRLRLSDWIFLILFISFFSFKFLFNNSSISLLLLTWNAYFGVLVLYLFFRVYLTRSNLNLGFLLSFFIGLVFIESLLVNTIVNPELLPNYPDVSNSEFQTHITHSGYQRPYSIGGNTSVTSSILIAIAASVSMTYMRYILLFAAVLVINSAAGMLLFLFFVICKSYLSVSPKHKYILTVFLTLLLVGVGALLVFYLDSLGVRLSSRYVLFLIEFKLEQIASNFSGYDVQHYLLGDISRLDASAGGYGYRGDFGWLEVVLGYGVVGSTLILTFILSNVNRANCLSILILLVGTLHYGVIHTVVGQFFLAYFMCQACRVGEKIKCDRESVYSNNFVR